MSSKTVPFSARISLEDASFISNLTYEGAVTPSDKLRALLAETRQRQQHSSDFAVNLQQLQHWLAPLKRQWQVKQQQSAQQVPVIVHLLEWLPQVLALLQSQGADVATASVEKMQQHEQHLLQQLYYINSLLLPLQLQRNPAGEPCYQDLVRLAHLLLSPPQPSQGD